jgi:hypothetical protein
MATNLHLEKNLSKHEALGLIPRTTKNKNK